MEINQRMGELRKKKKMIEMKKKMNNLTKEQLKAAIEKKKMCNTKAMSVIEQLIEPNVSEIWLLENLYHINQSHYQDAVEERAIIKYCGYPLCDTSLECIPRKQFHISTKRNKVYDITDRKNYCSNICYKSSTYLKEQLYTSPLWLRDCEDIVQYKLFSSASKQGSTGVEVDLGNINPVNSDETNESKNLCNNLDSEENSNIELNCNLRNRSEIICNLDTNSLPKTSDLNEINIKSVDDKSRNEANADNQPVNESKESQVKNERKPNDITAPDSKRNKKIIKKKDCIISVGDRVELFLESWITIYSLRFLYGDDKLKEILAEFGTPTERFGQLINTKDAFIYERYSEICRRLNLIELKEKVEDREETIPTKPKPLPDFEVLKEEAKELEIKVRSFYLGDKSVHFQNTENISNNEKENENSVQPILPLLDKYCVLATRRRIVLDKLYKTLPDIQSALGLANFNVRHEIQEFVHTLALTATNITMSPSEWNLVSIVVIKLFTLRNELLDYSFNSALTQKRLINLLLSYRLDLDFLQKCIIKLTNLEQIIKNSQ